MGRGSKIMYKVYDGERFKVIGQSKKKRTANKLAEQYRGMGYKARIHHFGKGGYRVYIRKK